MLERRSLRILRQHVETDRLLGVEAVPVGRPVALSVTTPATAPADVPGGLDRAEKLRLLTAMDENEVRSCAKCALCEGRTRTVFGEGDPDAALMFIGEGPGQQEDETGRPFVGRAGEMLDKQIAAIGLRREEVYIANVVKCRPPNNRAPTPAEADACWGYLRRQIEIIRPHVIVTLGAPATHRILQTRQGITSIRGTWQRLDLGEGLEIPVMPTFHPAYLLRAYTVENRRKVWSDLQKAAEKLKG